MYAELVMLNLGSGVREISEKMVPQFAALHESLKGFKSQTFFGDEKTGNCGCFSLWESKEDLDAAMAVCVPQLQKAVTGLVKEEPTIQVFEVFEPKK
jgi:hypothetical protein